MRDRRYNGQQKVAARELRLGEDVRERVYHSPVLVACTVSVGCRTGSRLARWARCDCGRAGVLMYTTGGEHFPRASLMLSTPAPRPTTALRGISPATPSRTSTSLARTMRCDKHHAPGRMTHRRTAEVLCSAGGCRDALLRPCRKVPSGRGSAPPPPCPRPPRGRAARARVALPLSHALDLALSQAS